MPTTDRRTRTLEHADTPRACRYRFVADRATAPVDFASPLAAYESPLHLLVSGRLLDADGNLVARLVSGSGWHTEGR